MCCGDKSIPARGSRFPIAAWPATAKRCSAITSIKDFPTRNLYPTCSKLRCIRHGSVTYRIKEGERVFVDQILISGLHYTHRPVVERQLQMRAGEPLSQNAALDTQRRLYDLGLFNEVNVAVQNPEGMAPEKNVIFRLEEAKAWTF